MFYTIYKTTNKLNGKIYIGKHQTKDLNDSYIGSGKRLRNSIRKNGIENFEKEILFVFQTEEEMNAKEAELVTEEFCLREDTYNLCPGGRGGFGYINKTSGIRNGFEKRPEDNRMLRKRQDKIRLDLFKNDKEWRENFIINMKLGLKKYYNENTSHWLGRKHTEETKNKIGKINSVNQLANKNSQYGTMWITNGSENRKIKKEIDPIPDGWKCGRVLLKR